jgi:hypothetical protein
MKSLELALMGALCANVAIAQNTDNSNLNSPPQKQAIAETQTENPNSLSILFQTGFGNKYVTDGGFELYDKFSNFTFIEAAKGVNENIQIGTFFWSHLGLDGMTSREIDAGAFVRGKVTEGKLGTLSARLIGMGYFYPDGVIGTIDPLVESGLTYDIPIELKKDFKTPLTLDFTYRHVFGHDELRHGDFAKLLVQQEFPIAKIGNGELKIFPSLSIGFGNDFMTTKDMEHYTGVLNLVPGATLSYTFGKNEVGAFYKYNFGNNDIPNNHLFGINLTRKF